MKKLLLVGFALFLSQISMAGGKYCRFLDDY